MENEIRSNLNRRNFLQKLSIGTAAGALSLTSCQIGKGLPKDVDGAVIPGFE